MERLVPKRSCSAALLGMLFVSLCQAEPSTSTAKLNLISDDFDYPVHITASPLRPEELVIVERDGLAKTLSRKDRSIRTILDIEDLINTKRSLGLLSLTFAPSSSDAGSAFIANYIDPQGDLVVARFANFKGGPANDETMSIVIKVAQIAQNSHGSQVQHLQDGTLLVTTGDGEEKNPPTLHAAQSGTSLLGKALRIIPKSSGGYTPIENRDRSRNNSTFPEIWALGFRNPTHASVDEESKRVFIIDNSDGVLEINLLEQGKNYGWDRAEGDRCVSGNCSQDNLTAPIISIPRQKPTDSLIGGAVYTGKLFPQLRGSFIFAEASSGTVFTAKNHGGSHWSHTPIAKVPNEQITAIGKDATGELYLATQEGSLFEIRP